MKLLLILLFSALPAFAEDAVPVSIPMETSVGNFEDEVASVSARLRQLMFESRLAKYGRQINRSISAHDPETAQAALDNMLRDFPEIKTKEPQAVEHHQSLINFWRKDFAASYKGFDTIIHALEKDYPNGVPPGKYAAINTSFMAESYFNRGSSEMQLRAFKQAAADFDKAYALMPKAYMQVNKCRALLPLKKYKEASEAFDLAYKVYPKGLDGIEDKGRICTVLAQNNFNPGPCLKPGAEGSK